ncbi:hypothetical protein [Aquabacterium sp.]|uniref:hypothetical protein n=1 Tax=Aquabacterium sp. TaxID=1872578 RepID=UPI002D185999|nr:hypothetical protein [Aquabacterium sp.]HSW06521.1 hypothetical protein [Aquabacterium sp.]
MAQDPREALIEGLSDAAGFVLGALAGWQLGRLLGFDVFASAGWDARAMVGVVLIALGCGAGKWAAMRWRAGRNTKR